jgi:hypothetical protein
VNRTHLDAMTDDVGMFQHATGRRPDRAYGYCTDDVARSLQVDMLHARRIGWASVADSARRSLDFLGAAFDESTGRFRNMRRADGRWVDEPGSEDAHGRAVHALGDVVANGPVTSIREEAASLFLRALPAAERLRSIRARSSVALGCDAALRGDVPPSVARTYRIVSDRLRDAVAYGATEAWPWPEARVTYEAALVPRALIVSGAAHGKPDTVALGLTVLDWLIDHATAPDGLLMPVGNGWWPSDGERSRFDQQPIEATSMLLAAAAAFDATSDDRYRAAMERCYAWFLGGNALGVVVADPARGASHDGLTPTGVNLNQGAESTLMWLTALEHVRALRAPAAASLGAPPAARRTPTTLVAAPATPLGTRAGPRTTRDGELRTGAGR